MDQLHQRAVSLELQAFEDPRQSDALYLANQVAGQRMARLTTQLLGMVRQAGMVTGIALLLATRQWWLALLIALGLLPLALIRRGSARHAHAHHQEVVHVERRASDYSRLLLAHDQAASVRALGLGPLLRQRYAAVRNHVRTQRDAFAYQRVWRVAGASVVGVMMFTGAIAWLLHHVSARTLSVGEFVVTLALLQRAHTAGNDLAASAATVYRDQLEMQRLLTFLDGIPPAANAPALSPGAMMRASPLAHPRYRPVPEAVECGLRLDEVRFSYQGGATPVLDGISLDIPTGRTTGIVGANGAGKSTLIKLLCGLYLPTHGCITLDGVDIREFDPVAYRRCVSVMLQDPPRFAESVAENIRWGDDRLPDGSPRVEEAARLAMADAFIAALPQGYHTSLRRDDHGVGLSGGEWQRLAMARALVRHAHLLVLDEPSSAMDARAERALFETLRRTGQDRMTVLISHRAAVLRSTDWLVLLERGRVVEAGTHAQLLAARGAYFTLAGEEQEA
jgi:ATP-binding cassette subfamily B protein